LGQLIDLECFSSITKITYLLFLFLIRTNIKINCFVYEFTGIMIFQYTMMEVNKQSVLLIYYNASRRAKFYLYYKSTKIWLYI